MRLTGLSVLLAAATVSSGCAALTNPVADGIPARLLPPELHTPSKAGEQMLPLNLLRQTPPADYRLAPGDVLAVYVEGYLGERTVPVPVSAAPPIQPRDQQRQAASTGYPVPVQDDGTVDLPAAGGVSVAGLTVGQAREVIRDLYVRKALVKTELARIIVSLHDPRRYTVLVLRQEAAAFSGSPESIIPTSKRGTGYEVQLPAYQNDVLHALTRTGGLPGLDAYDEVIVYRDAYRDKAGREVVLDRLGAAAGPVIGVGAAVTRIPLRAPAGSPPCVRPENVVLGNGDVVFLAAREREVFFSGGLLPPGQHMLPKDRDLDVVEAVSLVRGPLINGAFGGSNLSGAFIQSGIGNPSPGLLTVVRRTPNGGQVSIVVDLHSALREPSERILVQAGDLLVLQEVPGQAVARYLSQTVFNFNLYWRAFQGNGVTGLVDIGGPDRLSNRGAILNLNQP